MGQQEQQAKHYGVIELVERCAQVYTAIINSQIVRILDLESQIKAQEIVIYDIGKREAALVDELNGLKEAQVLKAVDLTKRGC